MEANLQSVCRNVKEGVDQVVNLYGQHEEKLVRYSPVALMVACVGVGVLALSSAPLSFTAAVFGGFWCSKGVTPIKDSIKNWIDTSLLRGDQPGWVKVAVYVVATAILIFAAFSLSSLAMAVVFGGTLGVLLSERSARLRRLTVPEKG